METKDFKRNSYKMVNPKVAKEGFKAALKKRRDVALVGEVLATVSATGRLLRGYQEYVVPGIQLKDAHRAHGRALLGELLQHAAAAAKLIKVKVPSANRKIKPKHTPTHLLMEVSRSACEMQDTVLAVVNGVKFVPMTDEETVKAKAAYEKRVAAAKVKFDAAPVTKQVKQKNEKGEVVTVEVPKGEFKAPATPAYTKPVTDALNVEQLGAQIAHLLASAYEFAWSPAVTPVESGAERVIAGIFEERIKALAPSYPAGFFDAPPKKPAPAGLTPPRKKKDAEATVAAAEAKQAAPEAVKA